MPFDRLPSNAECTTLDLSWLDQFDAVVGVHPGEGLAPDRGGDASYTDLELDLVLRLQRLGAAEREHVRPRPGFTSDLRARLVAAGRTEQQRRSA